jgi:hypothetical protein
VCVFAKVVDTELFKCLQDIHGEGYDGFIARKLVPVVGDVREANVGIAPDLADEIADQVDVIINSAANTTFDERCVIDASSYIVCSSVIHASIDQPQHPPCIGFGRTGTTSPWTSTPWGRSGS